MILKIPQLKFIAYWQQLQTIIFVMHETKTDDYDVLEWEYLPSISSVASVMSYVGKTMS